MGMTNAMGTVVQQPTSTASTDPLAAELAGAPMHTMEAIVSLRVVGTMHELVLPFARSFVLGSGSRVDVRIPAEVAGRKVSREHARVTRTGDNGASWLRVEDLGSTNGTSFQGVRQEQLLVSAGQRFKVAATELMVMDKLLVGLRRSLGAFLGFDDHHRLDHDVVALQDEPLVILGARGSERGQLAGDLHRYSKRRHRPFIEIGDPTAGRVQLDRIFDAAVGGTVFVALDKLGTNAPLASLIALALDRARDVRPIFVAPSWEEASLVLSNAARLFRPLQIPPISSRRQDVPALLDLMLGDQGSAHRVAALDGARVAAMSEYAWPRNRTELRETAARLAALIEHKGNLSAAAAAIRQDYETYRRALARVGAIAIRARGRSDE